ncbi:conserved domain protein [Candidatus Vecturithrix granuli]|uniref:Conserved domain protein n=1 Tax=Vecturithrix granuli TaxID=1499967 RepID=A0A081BXS2_VECG1|nr:conserved domain protein [Candidatus Vecturithrix granuli]
MPTQAQDSQSHRLKMINFHLHDNVKVKAGTADPDFGNDISGWQGRIKEIDPESEREHVVYLVAWDSLTLQAMDLPLIVRSEKEGLSWTEMYLFDTDLEPAVCRDATEDVIRTTKELQQAYRENWQNLKNTAV